MYYDWTYIVLVLPAVILSVWASLRVNGAFKKYQKQLSSRGITASQAARMILDANGLGSIRIECISGELTDHYDPRDNVIRLSSATYSSSSTAAIGVAAHEVGHAIQHATGYAPLRIRSAIVPITSIGSRLAIPLILAGLILGYMSNWFVLIGYVGVACFALCAVFQLVTLPTEFNASKRALAALQESEILYGEELTGAKKVLWAAAMTYVAALAVSLMQLLRFLVLLGNRRD